MTKTMINRAAGLFSLLVFLILSMLNITEGIEKHILFLGFGFILTIASVFVISKAFPEGEGRYWFAVTPFSLLAIVARAIFGWDILLPFILCAYGALGLSGFAMNSSGKNNPKSYENILPLVSVVASAAVYIGLCAVVGVFI